MEEELKNKIARIVREAVESRMDWEAYYSGESEESVKEILSLFSSHLFQLRERIEGMKTPEEILKLTPEGVVKVAMLNQNKIIDDVLKIIKEGGE